MAEETKEKWLNYVALTTVIFAVFATLSTFNGAKYSTRSVLSQTQAANQWAYYQAKSIKGYLYENQMESMEMEMPKSRGTMSKPTAEAYEKKMDFYRQKIEKYDAEKKDIFKEAKQMESVRDASQKHSSIFGLAVIFLQIAILLCSISALMKKKPLWILGSVTGLVGSLYFVNGFFLFF